MSYFIFTQKQSSVTSKTDIPMRLTHYLNGVLDKMCLHVLCIGVLR